MKIEDMVRNGIITAQDGIIYKTLFIGKNFLVYRLVDANSSYRGNHYKTDGWILAWADMSEYMPERAPTFVSLRGDY